MLSFLKRELWRFRFYKSLESLAFAVLIFFAVTQFGFFSKLFFQAFIDFNPFFILFRNTCVVVGMGLSLTFLYFKISSILKIKISDVASEIEKQNIYFKEHPNRRGELRTAALMLENSLDNSSEDFQEAHLNIWNRRLPKFQRFLLPRREFYFSIALIFLTSSLSIFLHSHYVRTLPTNIQPWTPTQFEIRLPFEGAIWNTQPGALSGIASSEVRFKTPKFSWGLRTFLYVQELNQKWVAYPCKEFCELTLKERGQYAVGTQFFRSSFFPLQVVPDEAPKAVLMVKVDSEWLPATTIEVLNKKELLFQFSASDDIRLTQIELRHRFQDTDEVVQKWSLHEDHFKQELTLSLEGWKGGAHEVYLKLFDATQSANSAPIYILFADENTLREKRLQDLRAMLDEWVHVLGDLIDTDQDQKLAGGLLKRFQEMTYPEQEENSLMTAYIKELKSLGHRIENWAKFSPDFSELKKLIPKTEKAILYGLSLMFQEKTGEIQAAADSLHSSRDDLNKMLEKIREGKMDLNSKDLDEAFKKLASQLEEMQKKIRELPQGPQDDLLNREALQNEADESDNLLKRIEDIKKQAANGDNKGALKELESLLNQLSILSKEMERSLDQWKNNLDKGALQSAERYSKSLKDIQKQQEELAKKTDRLKEKAEKLEGDSQKNWQPIDPDKAKALKKEFAQAQKEQQKISEKLKQTIDQYDKDAEGSEWQQVLRSNEAKQSEEQISDRMKSSSDALNEAKAFESMTNQAEAIELLKNAQKSQQQTLDNIKSAGSSSSKPTARAEKVEIVGNEKQGEKERRRKIMDSLKQKVDDRYQKSHEHYFEDLLQR
ncbi:MAG: hypothetical protein J0L93_03890 [Deltaproteobacteria bacterium]|nr:hypothetical protein [Deltaproteobacteria bacterium]